MRFFKKIPNTKYPLGVEWPLLKKMPLVTLLGTILFASPSILLFFKSTPLTATDNLIIYKTIGALFSLWFFAGTVVIGCCVIIVMKGPAYVADAYPLPQEDNKLETSEH